MRILVVDDASVDDVPRAGKRRRGEERRGWRERGWLWSWGAAASTSSVHYASAGLSQIIARQPYSHFTVSKFEVGIERVGGACSARSRPLVREQGKY